jgi:hypothetical protein
MIRPTVSRSISLGVKPNLRRKTRLLLLSCRCWFVDVGRPLWREDGSVIYSCYWVSPAQSFLLPSAAGLTIIFYYHRFETPPTWRVRSLYFISPRVRVAHLYPQVLGWLFKFTSKSKLCYDRRSVDQSVLVSSSTWGPTPDFCYCQAVAVLLTWNPLSDYRMGLSFTISAGPRQDSHSRIRVFRDSWPYFNYGVKAYGGVDIWVHVFFISALVGDNWSASLPDRFTPGERASGILRIGGWVGPGTGLDYMKKRKSSHYQDSNSVTSAV